MRLRSIKDKREFNWPKVHVNPWFWVWVCWISVVCYGEFFLWLDYHNWNIGSFETTNIVLAGFFIGIGAIVVNIYVQDLMVKRKRGYR